ncbi:MAG: chaperonin GroEL, partial [Candidatus Omnitrophica bacterium]|nr:chaperonin GroEL [Candidatus Omnitrophota bacterium]
GIVPGGGVALLRAIPALERLKLEGDEKIGVDIVKRALEEPIRQIAQNSGVEGVVVAQKVKEEKGTFGFDAEKQEYTDMIKAGIIDPLKVVRLAIQNAASIAGLILTTEAAVCELPEKEKTPPIPPSPHGEY